MADQSTLLNPPAAKLRLFRAAPGGGSWLLPSLLVLLLILLTVVLNLLLR